MTCTLCPLGENVITNCVPGRGNGKLMIVGEAPGPREDFMGECFVGPSGKYLTAMLEDAGITQETVRLTNAVRCKPPTVAGKQTPPEQSHIDFCRAHLKAEIHRVKPEAIIALGAVALKSLTKLGGIMSKRGQSFPLHKDFEYDCEVWATLHPAYVMRVPQARRGVVSDLQRVRDRHKPPDEIAWSWWNGEVLFADSAVGFDIETDYDRKTKKGGDKMTQCAVAVSNHAYVAYGEKSHDLARKLAGLNVFTLNGWNFDNPKCHALGIAVPHGIDVSALAYLDDETQPLGLEPLAVKYLGVRGWKDEREADPGSDAFAIYNARDARHTLDLARYFFKNLGKSRAGAPRTRIVTDIMAPARLALDECTKRGIPLNIGPIRAAVTKYRDDVAHLHNILTCFAAESGIEKFNPNSTKQVQAFLGIEGSTAIGVLENMGSSPKVDALKAYRKAKKALSTYALSYERMATTGDGRAHTEYTIWRTLTGRTSSRKSQDYDESANVQNLPRVHKNFFGGYWADYSAIEFRLAAWVAGERSILNRYGENPAWDPHRYFASILYAKPEAQVTANERQIAKSANFSQLFCGNGQTLLDYAGKMGLHLTLDFCRQVHTAWHTAFPGFRRAYADVQRELLDYGYVETATGFRRHYGDFNLLKGENRMAAIREAVNVKLGQGIAAHVALLGLAECHRRGLPIIGFIHDSVGFDYPDSTTAERARDNITEALTQVPVQILKERFNVTLDVPLMIDYKT